MIRSNICLLLSSILFLSCNNTEGRSEYGSPENVVNTLDYQLITAYPHDTTSFTEGLLIHNGNLYESTGATSEIPGTRSLYGIVDLSTGKIGVKAEIDPMKYFGEGIAILDGKIFQLTYKTKIGFIYNAETYKKLGEFTFPGKEGWGLTNDQANLIMSDGTDVLTYLDPNNLRVIKNISVSENGYVKDYLNELEYINGFIYANIWNTNTIVKIDPADGKVVGKLDLTTLASDAKSIYPGSLEMNGIAYNPASDKILVTGKMWPKIYEIKLSH